MTGKVKVTPTLRDEIVRTFISWRLEGVPFAEREARIRPKFGVHPTTFYKAIPQHVKRAPVERLPVYLAEGWHRDLEEVAAEAMILQERDRNRGLERRVAALELGVRHVLRSGELSPMNREMLEGVLNIGASVKLAPPWGPPSGSPVPASPPELGGPH